MLARGKAVVSLMELVVGKSLERLSSRARMSWRPSEDGGAELLGLETPSRDEEEVDAKELSWLLGKRLHRA